jgi:hypothetical protein
MISINNTFKFILISTLLALACAGHLQRRQAVSDSRMAGESQFEPLGFAGDDAVVTGKNPERGLKSDTSRTDSISVKITANPIDTTGQKDQTIFRVQIYTTKSMDDAQEYSQSIKQLFPEGVFVEYQIPYYKVRVGEFRNVTDGQIFLEKVKKIGFENAWLVRIVQ